MKRILIAFLALLTLSGCGGAKKTQITNIASLNYSGSKVGIPDSNSFDKEVVAELPNAELKFYSNSMDAVMALTAGKLDAFAYDRCNLDYMAAANDKVSVLPDSLGDMDICTATAKGNTALLAEFNKFIADYKADGTAEDMYSRWILQKEHEMPQIESPTSPSKKLKVITNGVTEPMNFYQGTELTGYDVEFAMRFALAYNYDIEFIVMDYAAMPLAITSGKADCIISDFFYNAERAQEIDYSSPYITTQITLLVEKDRLASSQTAN